MIRRLRFVAACGLVLGLALAAPGVVPLAWAKEKKSPKAVGEQPATTAEAKKDTPAGKIAEKKDAEKKDAEKKDAGDEKASPHRVKKGPMRVEVSLDGVFEAQNMTEISIRPQEWAGLVVLKAVEHGTVVKRGDLILALDTEKIDRTIADTTTDLQLGELSLKQAEQQLQAMEKLAPLDMAVNQRTHRIVEEDTKQFHEVDKPLALKSTEFMLQMSRDMLEYQEEELRQLEKMYKADDLTEETEAIVLKRARDTVKRAKFSLERAKAAHDEALKFNLPRVEERVKDAAERANIDFARAKIALPLTLGKQRIDFEKLKVQRTLAEEKLKKLMADRAAMTVKAPGDGVVYYGKCSRGRWVSSSTSGDALRRGAAILSNEIVMTLVQPRPLIVRATLPESHFQDVKAGQQGVVEPAGLPGVKLTVVVARVAGVPMSSGSFDIQLTVALDSQADALMPGMAGGVKILAYQKLDALTVPTKAVMTDESDLRKSAVYVVGKGDKPEKRTVTAGHRTDKQVEILRGLSEGDQVLLERPKE